MFRQTSFPLTGRGTRFEACESNFRCGLLCFLLAAAFRVRQFLLGEPHFHFECFLVFGAEFIAHAVLNGPQPTLLQPFLQRGLVIGAIQAVRLRRRERDRAGCGEGNWRAASKTGIEIDRSEDSFVSVGEQRVFSRGRRFSLRRDQGARNRPGEGAAAAA